VAGLVHRPLNQAECVRPHAQVAMTGARSIACRLPALQRTLQCVQAALEERAKIFSKMMLNSAP